ncbi:hypothetical protein ACIA8C_06450 [Nocardia sp. NPDC051321]|uniref:hypothetical protein n=1 Tax=Nocardia sp. NPDC051321 TaxID=3364323 RepID=UPI0037B88789
MRELVRIGEAFRRRFRCRVEKAGGVKPVLADGQLDAAEAELKPMRVVAARQHGDDAEQFRVRFDA